MEKELKPSRSHFQRQVNLIEQEINEALEHLDHWMADDSVSTNLFNVPAVSCVKKGNIPISTDKMHPMKDQAQHVLQNHTLDPLGVALVLGAWNYPVMLGLHPVVGAVAAGNCVMIKPGSYAENVSNCIAR
jgi:aldehyde dehydrogenase (NAD+)